MLCNAGEITAVPFPFVDRPEVKRRPVLVLSKQHFNASHRHTLCAMITTARHCAWESDVSIARLQKTNLPAPSVVRMKIFTIDNRLIQKKVGVLDSQDWNAVRRTLAREVVDIS